MLPNVTAYHKPTTVDEALRLLQQRNGHAVALAGGTALLARRYEAPQMVVDLSGLGLDFIRRGAENIEIGAMTTLQSIVDSSLLAGIAGGLLATAAHATATRTIRNCATLGGSIIGFKTANDLVVALLALDAAIVSATGDTMRLADALANGGVSAHVKLLLEVRLPLASSDWRPAFERIARLPSDKAIVNVAAVLCCEHGVCKDVRLAAGGVGKTPIRLTHAERLLRGTLLSDNDIKKAIDAQMKEVSPLSNIMGSSEYRSEMLGVLLRRAVQRCRGGEDGP